jgi:hypothetical protein
LLDLEAANVQNPHRDANLVVKESNRPPEAPPFPILLLLMARPTGYSTSRYLLEKILEKMTIVYIKDWLK